MATHQSSFTSPLNIGNCQEAASLICANLEVNKTNGVLVAVPIPEVTKTDLGFINIDIQSFERKLLFAYFIIGSFLKFMNSWICKTYDLCREQFW